MKLRKTLGLVLVSTLVMGFLKLKIQSDGPPALSPQESQKAFQLAEGFKIELVASEPLLNEPTSVCWDQDGQMYASELHGYNLEGQLEIEELNKKGKIDTLVRRIEAASEFKTAAQKGTYGTIKKLVDNNQDGQMDEAIVFADKIPPAYGLCAALGGIIVAGQTSILYLADKDKDGKAEHIDTLFKGFEGGALERGINAPQWGPDGWIYFGRGWNGGKITGSHLKVAVDLPGSNFRIRADGSAIEPVTGSTHTIGHAFTADGESFFSTTWKHALYAAPIPWRYLVRNPDATISSLEADASDYSIVFPTAKVHPWKVARSNKKEWNSLYSKYGLAESAEGGYFTSSCSPMIYQDNLFPAEFKDNLFVCEPAQCMIHRCLVSLESTGMRVKRAKTEQNREFLTSTDSWFRPVSVVTGPDGSLYLTDMYREIIEDYSAVPRFMQQKYGLKNGTEHGRIWRISPTQAPKLAQLKKPAFTEVSLEKQLHSPHYWMRQTADRLIREKEGNNAPILFKNQLKLSTITVNTLPTNIVKALREQDTLLIHDVQLARKLALLSTKLSDERVLLQMALSLGYSQDAVVFEALTNLARRHGHVRWMNEAILTGVHHRAATMLTSLLKNPGAKGHLIFENLAETISAAGNVKEINALLVKIAEIKSEKNQFAALTGLRKNLSLITLSTAGQNAIDVLLNSPNIAVKSQCIQIASILKLSDSRQLDLLRQNAILEVSNQNVSSEKRLAAINVIADAPDAIAGPNLILAYKAASLPLKVTILDALINRGDRIKYLTQAFLENKISPTALLPQQKTLILERASGTLRPQIEAEFAKTANPDKEVLYNRYALALDQVHDIKHGQQLFTQMCSTCHQVGNVGAAVGPDLKNSYSNSNQTILRNILFPSEKIASGYDIHTVLTNDNESYSGIMASETPNSVVLKYIGGTEQTFLRKNIKKLNSSASSLMPEYGEALNPKDCSDIIFWLKNELGKR